MLKRLVEKRALIFKIWVVLVAVMGVISFMYGDIEDRGTMFILSIIVPFLMYGFVRFMFKVVLGNASLKTVSFYAWFFIIGCTLGLLLSLGAYVMDFPNSFSPSNTAMIGVVIGVLDAMDKIIEKEQK